MTPSRPLPCGAWPSPLSPERAAAGGVSLAYAGATGGRLLWIEGRPAERGRSVLMAREPDGRVHEPLPAEANVRSRVHEYGGLPWAAVAAGLVVAQFDDQRLYLHPHPGGGAPMPLTPPGCRWADACTAPDGRTLVAVREDHRAPGEPANALVALDTGRPGEAGTVLYGASDFVAAPQFSADGRRLAFIAWDHPAMPWDASRLLVGEFADGALANVQAVAGGPGESVIEPRWDGDGSLYFLSDRTGWWNLYRWRDGRVQAVTALQAEIGAPLWQLGQASYALGGDGRALLRIGRGAVDTLARLDLASGALTELALPYVAYASVGLLDADTGCAIAAAVDDLPVLITIDLRRGTQAVVRASGDAPLAPEAVSVAEAVEFATAPGPDGAARTAQAWYYPPRLPGCEPQPGERAPLMVLLHGGPTSQAGPAFKTGVQFWTTRGWAVVDVNYGGSSGWGRAYRERLRGQWGVVDLQDAVAAVDHLVAAGRADGSRVVIRGGSAGGYTVLSGLAFTQRFAAGINYYGVADLEGLAADTHKFESRYLDALVAPLPQGREVYRQRSPVHHMQRCKAALITFQGSDDRAVPPAQSRAIVAAAREAGCPVAYLEFEGEGHGFRQAATLVRALQAELAFLGRVLGYTPAEALPALEIENLP
ncbi:MAG: S9 family peptidase [Burkholderiales bacterium]|nr:S9 family peptidase [Burkholderiales bacterium]